MKTTRPVSRLRDDRTQPGTLRQFSERGEAMRGTAVTPPSSQLSAAQRLTQVRPGIVSPQAAATRPEAGQAARADRSPVRHRGARETAQVVRAVLTFSTTRQAGPALARVPGGSHLCRQEIQR